MDVFDILSNGKQSDEDFETIRVLARKKHFERLKRGNFRRVYL